MIGRAIAGILVVMTFPSLVIALSIVVICAASAVAVANEPPFWMTLIVCVATYPVGTAVLGLPVLADVGHGFVGEWSVRLAVVSAVTALLSPYIGERGRGPRAGAAGDRAGPRPEPAFHGLCWFRSAMLSGRLVDLPPGGRSQEVGHARGVVPGVEDDEDGTVTHVPAVHVDEVFDHSGTWAAVTSAAGPMRTASRSRRQEVRPVSRAATKEYGRPGTSWSEDRSPRPWT